MGPQCRTVREHQGLIGIPQMKTVVVPRIALVRLGASWTNQRTCLPVLDECCTAVA